MKRTVVEALFEIRNSLIKCVTIFSSVYLQNLEGLVKLSVFTSIVSSTFVFCVGGRNLLISYVSALSEGFVRNLPEMR